MQIEIRKTGDERSAKVCVSVNGSGRTFGGTNAAFEYLNSLVRETQSAVDSAIGTYLANRESRIKLNVSPHSERLALRPDRRTGSR